MMRSLPIVLFALSAWPVAAAGVSFRHDVMAALSKAGCNLGTCHGNARGKGGFQLSLRGQDPAGDFQVLTRDWLTRRTNVSEPGRSLLLLKPTMQIAHEGGQRFSIDSAEYAILHDWIAGGCRDDQPPRLVALNVTPTDVLLEAPQWEFRIAAKARFADGTMRDVSTRAVYETGSPIVEVSREGAVKGLSAGETVVLVRYLDQQVPVRLALIPARTDFAWQGPAPVNVVDDHVFAKLKRLKLNPSPECDDAVFLRRTALDLIGVLPTSEEARRFAADPSPDKRVRWVDGLLERPEFASWWALKWADMLRIEEKTLDAKGAQVFHAWLRNAFAQDMPLDELVRQLVSGRGSTYADPPANFYRALRDPFDRSQSVGQLFLGVRLQCAKCHNHPFDRWTQDDYYSWGNVFARVDYKILENKRRDSNDSHEFDGEQIVFQKPDGDVPDPRTDKPRPPQFLGDARVSLADADDRLAALANWLTRPENDRFAQMLVNRMWRHLMGRGLVEPVDDFRATNPATHPELLQALANELRSNGFQLKPLLKQIALSRTYQIASQPTAANADDETNYSHALVRRLSAEQLADALSQACGVPLEFGDYPTGTKAAELPGVGAMQRRRGKPSAGDDMLRVFGKPPRLQSCECERTEETTLSQAFWFLSGSMVQRMTSDAGSRAIQGAAAESEASAAVTRLYWSALSRPPSADELEPLAAFVEKRRERKAALQDILWALVTSPEFVLRR